MGNIIEVNNLTYTYIENDIFKRLKGVKEKGGIVDISFQVNEGEIFSMIGLNGAGKTTLLKCILGLIKADSGSVAIMGKDKLKADDFENLGYLPEISYYPRSMKLVDLINYYGKLCNLKNSEIEKTLDEILKEFGILDRKNDRLSSFSKGMLQKVGIIQAIINRPKLLFLDEPMSGLDPIAREKFMKIIFRLKDQGTTIFLNTHILEDVAHLSDRVAIINNGKLIELIDMNEKKDKAKYRIRGKKGNKKLEISCNSKELKIFSNKFDEIEEIEKQSFSLKEYFFNRINEGEVV